MRGSPGSPGRSSSRRASRARGPQPLARTFSRGSGRRVSVERDNSSPIRSDRISDVSRQTSFAHATSAVQLVEAGDTAGFEKFISALSSSQRTLAYSPERAGGHAGGSFSLLLAGMKRGDLPLIRAILKWIPEGQAGSVVIAKDENDEQTVLMLAAATGNPEVFEKVASMLPRGKVPDHLISQCARGNSVLMYAVKAGCAAMIEAVVTQFRLDEAVDALCMKNFLGETPLMHAARAPTPGAFIVIANMLPKEKLVEQLQTKTEEGQTALAIATRTGSVATWKAVANKIAEGEVNRQLMSTDIYGETAVMLAVRSANKDVFATVVARLTESQMLAQLGARNEHGQTPAQVAVACNAEAVLAAMVRPEWVSACLLDAPDESEAQLTALDLAVQPPVKLRMLRCLLACGATPTARVVLKLVRMSDGGDCHGGNTYGERSGPAVARECFLGALTASEWAINPLIPGLNLSIALMEARRQSPDFRKVLKELHAEVDALVLSIFEHLPDTIAGFSRLSTTSKAGVTSPRPFKQPPASRNRNSGHGSIGEDVFFADDGAGSGNKTLYSTIAQGVSRKRLELPRGTPVVGAGITLVQEILEPELAGLQPKHCAGPLAQAVQSRHLEFICTPLVVNYLRLKFSAGLPNPFRETNWRRDRGLVDRNLERFMVDDDESQLRVYILQGGCADSPSWTYLPGLQFILAGLVGKTAAFYSVPAMRLALDVLVYVGVIAVFVLKVVVLEDAGVVSTWEVIWLCYLLGAIWQQVREVQEAGSIRRHFFNPWNVVETTTLATLTVAFFFRTWALICDGHGEWLCGEMSADGSTVSDLNEVYLAQYFQAASAPLVLGRVLFLTQIHSSLGPLMHSTFQMFMDLARFGTLMLVIILGFALAFYAMFGSKSAQLPQGGVIEAYDTYYSSLLTLFGSMLGNFDFSVFDGAPMEGAGVVLLVFFLCVMNITLLNLLVAILTTAHARVELNSDKEALLSEALIIIQYRRAMRSDSLPSPFNLPQELISNVFWRHKERTKEIFARGIFWLISGPLTVGAIAILWTVSLPLTVTWASRVLRSNGTSMLIPSLLGISFSLGVAPIFSAWLWIKGVVGIWRQGRGIVETSDRNEIEASRAHRRRSFAGGPSSPIASIAIAVADAKKSKSIKFSDENSSALGRNGDASKPKSAFWQRASQIGHVDHDAEGAVTGRQRGFDVVAAVRRVHGLTIQQLKERLDILSESKKKYKLKHQRDNSLAEALVEVQRSHKRLEEVISKVDDNRARTEKKMEELVGALRSSINIATAQGRAEDPASSVATRMGGAGEGEGEERTFPFDNQARDDNRRPGQIPTQNLDDFINEYHAEITRR